MSFLDNLKDKAGDLVSDVRDRLDGDDDAPVEGVGGRDSGDTALAAVQDKAEELKSDSVRA